MANHFDEAMEQVFINEGGLRIAPDEPGGGSNMGISLITLQSYRKVPSTLEDLEKLTKDEAKQIYAANFWDMCRLNEVDGKLSAIVMMDQAVNRGLGGFKRLLVTSLNYRNGTEFTEMTAFPDLYKIVNEVPDREFFRRFICDMQFAYLDLALSDPAKKQHLRRWLIRTHNLLKLLV